MTPQVHACYDCAEVIPALKSAGFVLDLDRDDALVAIVPARPGQFQKSFVMPYRRGGSLVQGQEYQAALAYASAKGTGK